MHAHARKTDPSTPHESAEAVERRGHAASQRHLCLLEVWKRPGSTAAEIAARCGLERHVPSRRLPELRQAGQVRNGDPRTCTVTGNPSMTWEPIPNPDAIPGAGKGGGQ